MATFEQRKQEIATGSKPIDTQWICTSISASPGCESYPSSFLHFLDRATEVPGTSEAPLDRPSYASSHSLDVLRNGSIDLWAPTRQPFLPSIVFRCVIGEEISSDIHGFLQTDPLFALDDGDEVVSRVTTGLFLVVTVNILQCEVYQFGVAR